MKLPADRRIVMALAVLAVMAAGGAAWRAGLIFSGGDAESERRNEFRRDRIVSVSVGSAKIADVPVTIDAVGTVQALNTVTARTQVDGRLVDLAFTEGQEVKRGDVLARIDPSLYQAQYDQAVARKAQDEANLANARIDASRYQKLLVGNFGSKQQYATQKALVAQLEAQVRADQAAIDNARTTLDYATIRSPIDGRTGIRLVDVGNILHPGDASGIVVVTQLKPIWVVFTVPQQSLPALQKAQGGGAAKVAALGPDNASVIETGELSVIDNQIDAQTGTVRVKAKFQNPELALWPGQFVNVRIVVDTLKNVVTLPSPAVQRGPNGAFVYLLGPGGTAVMKNIATGRQDDQVAVVTSEFDVNAKVIVSGFARLSDGAKVRIAEGEGAAGGPPGGSGDKPRGERKRKRDADASGK